MVITSLLKIEPTGSIYCKKRAGANIYPGGTPQDKCPTDEETLPYWTQKH